VFPKELHIDVTNHCNKACSICPMRNRYNENIFPLGFMDMELFKDIIDECKAYLERPELTLHKDGEPLLHPRIAEMVRYAKVKGCFTHFATNGILLAKRKREVIDSGLDLLTISITDTVPVESIKAFMDYKGDRLPFTQIKSFNGRSDFPKVDKVIHSEIHEWTDSPSRETRMPCSKLLTSAAITWDGYYCLCCVDYKREMAPLNIKTTSIKEAWEFSKMIYKAQNEGIFFPPCKTCNYWTEHERTLSE